MVTYAATLTTSPASGTYTVGQTISVSVSVASPGQTLNAVSASLGYSQDTMEIVSVSKSPSIFSLWVQEPTYSNQSGVASFEGVVLNPGFIGSSGKLITYNFRVKAPGTGTVRISNGSILANDGNGTDIFTGSGNASFTLLPASAVPTVVPPTPAVVALDEKLPPFLSIKEIPRDDFSNPVAQFAISVLNTKEVFKKFQLKIDQSEPFVWENKTGKDIFITGKLSSGPHILLVKTLEGEKPITGYAEFLIDTFPQPKIAYSTRLVTLDQPIVIYGTTEIGNGVTVSFKKNNQEVYREDLVVDTEGKFLLIAQGKLARGNYDIDLFAHNDAGARSTKIADMRVSVKSAWYIKVGNMVVETYVMGIVLGAIALLAIIGAWIHKRKYIFPQKTEVIQVIQNKPRRKKKIVVDEV